MMRSEDEDYYRSIEESDMYSRLQEENQKLQAAIDTIEIIIKPIIDDPYSNSVSAVKRIRNVINSIK